MRLTVYSQIATLLTSWGCKIVSFAVSKLDKSFLSNVSVVFGVTVAYRLFKVRVSTASILFTSVLHKWLK